MIENEKYLKEQIITYLGNKRHLLDFINNVLIKIKKELNKDKIDTFDVFAGGGLYQDF